METKKDKCLITSGQLEYISMSVYEFSKNDIRTFDSGINECAIVVLSGIGNVESDKGLWNNIGKRMNIFEGIPPSVLYLPIHTGFKITALSNLHIAVALAPSQRKCMPTYVEYSKIQKEKRGSGNRTRFVHRLKTADADTKIVLFEVYTPSGNWSSYPPHKHDEEKPPKESLLQEFYYYRFDPDKGFALQWNFNDDLSFNQAIAVRNNDMISVPKGYHTVCAAPGYDCYYLNAMAGPTTNWNFTVHPDHVHLQDY